MAISTSLLSFNAGEWSPLLDGRSDLQKYGSACRIQENFIPSPQGAAFRRPGTEFRGIAKYSSKKSVVIGFNFSTTTRFVIEVGDLYMRFWKDGDAVANPSDPTFPLEVSSPYLEADLNLIKYIQINDVMFFVHPLYPPYKLSRIADNNWTMIEVIWDWPQVLDENVTTTTITPSATTGFITLTASQAIFSADQVGSYFQISHNRTTTYITKAIDSNLTSTSGITVLGGWTFTTSGTWIATLVVERSYDGGSNWEIIRTFTSPSTYQNFNEDGKEEKESILRIRQTTINGGVGSSTATLTVDDGRDAGFVRITGFTSASVVSATVINSLYATTATPFWNEGAFSTKRGFPRSVALHEDRIFYGGTLFKPVSVWGSVTEDFSNFRQSSLDDAGLFFTLYADESNPIQWMLSQDVLLIGTAGDEWTLGSPDASTALTPSNIQVKRQSKYGSKAIRAVIAGDVILFVQRQGRQVRELVYQFEKDGFVAADLNLLSEHVTIGEITQCAMQTQRDAIYWAVTGNGVLIGMTYERAQQVVGWHRHTTDGVFESVTTIYGLNTSDEVWFTVRRTVNGQTVRYIERFNVDWRNALDDEDKPNWFYVDCGKKVTGSITSVTDLSHLEGKSVSILADGAMDVSQTVVGGSVPLSQTASTAVVGLPYISTIKPMALEISLQDGTSRGRKKRVTELTALVYKSFGGEFASAATIGYQQKWYPLIPRPVLTNLDTSPPATTGGIPVNVAGASNYSGDISIRQGDPFPLVILALIPVWEPEGR